MICQSFKEHLTGKPTFRILLEDKNIPKVGNTELHHHCIGDVLENNNPNTKNCYSTIVREQAPLHPRLRLVCKHSFLLGWYYQGMRIRGIFMTCLRSLVSWSGRQDVNTWLWPADLKTSTTYLSSNNLKNPNSKPFSRRPTLVLPLNSDFAPFSLFPLPPTIVQVRHRITGKFLSGLPGWNQSLSVSVSLSLSFLHPWSTE